jgi:HPt (histidine-containing phosphotransfer) domain-containing protein
MINRALFASTYQNFDNSVVCEIIDIYIEELPERMTALQFDIKNPDFEQLVRDAHSIKGVIANFYDETARHLAYRLEEKGKAKDSDGLVALFSEFRIACESLAIELQSIKKEYQ